nr:MAG TPA: hypothetical protein [Caudoviricetes sp.]
MNFPLVFLCDFKIGLQALVRHHTAILIAYA